MALDVLEAEDGVEFFGEDGLASVGMQAQDAAFGGVGGTRDVHGILGDKDASVGGAGDDGGMAEMGCLGDEFHLPTVAGFGDGLGVKQGGDEKGPRETTGRECADR